MSALPQNTGPAADPSEPHGDGGSDAHSGQSGADGGLQDQSADIGTLIRAALANDLAPSSAGEASGVGDAGGMEAAAPVYDAHVPLALDSEFLPAIDSTLDLLTTSTDLFDVPVADFGPSLGDGAEA